ncbi:MAG TPA: glycerophosphodiester phosphodiesterase family protein [Niabella sp.]|nr:glycerophosphodiester phosphodiesterase family protein [Niabella sp.]HOZ96540.1 glycerophosphodiester phosphodiesterase family protein [Niabella sp.]HQW13279.1 glycerophosphodiester phosphodiesterase family protein [Niabella sp.]HQX18681.1 glycerophosphodiester phosphodiesterase family protein [Niabella sp.]HQX40334.1 glycerophosphodiester phosphodiesterase family protein [Niabella sp.]
MYRFYKVVLFLGFLLLGNVSFAQKKKFDTQAHRGGRGLMPENTIPAMLDAIDRGISTLELDLQLSKDLKVVVSHDPYFNANFVTTPAGDTLTKDAGKKNILYQLNYDSIAKYDVGQKVNPEFPQQKKMKVHKPLLSDLLNATEAYSKKKRTTIHYNIEIKSAPGNDGKYYPNLEAFVDLAMDVINKKKISKRVIIQSFDTRALQMMHKKYPSYALSYLILAKEKRPIAELIKVLGFVPDVLSPQYNMVTGTMVKECHQQGIKIVPWTVNELKDIQSLKAMGVDGIISDYTDLFSQL